MSKSKCSGGGVYDSKIWLIDFSAKTSWTWILRAKIQIVKLHSIGFHGIKRYLPVYLGLSEESLTKIC
jgi:hypothetical protein